MNTLTDLIRPALAALLLCTGLPAQAVDWFHCAKEGETCTIPGNEPVLVRYGHPNYGYIYQSMLGKDKIACNGFNGDPEIGVTGKTCSYTNAPGFADNTIVSIPIANQDQSVTWSKQLRWVHYGLTSSTINGGQGTWWNTLQSENWKCSDDGVNFNPTPGQTDMKKCYEGLPVAAQVDTDGVTPLWQSCGVENSDCVIPVNLKNTPLVLRYGSGSQWTYRIAMLSKAKIKCQTQTFGQNPVNVAKVCEYVPIVPPAQITGQWNQIIDTSCAANTTSCNIRFDLYYGTDYTADYTKNQMKAWANVVKTSLQKNGLPVLNGKTASSSALTAYSDSKTYQSALTHVLMPIRTKCAITSSYNPTPGSTIKVYQFATSSAANCLKDGSCDKTTSTKDLFCVSNPSADYQGPQCLPGYCDPNDPLCRTCTY